MNLATPAQERPLHFSCGKWWSQPTRDQGCVKATDMEGVLLSGVNKNGHKLRAPRFLGGRGEGSGVGFLRGEEGEGASPEVVQAKLAGEAGVVGGEETRSEHQDGAECPKLAVSAREMLCDLCTHRHIGGHSLLEAAQRTRTIAPSN